MPANGKVTDTNGSAFAPTGKGEKNFMKIFKKTAVDVIVFLAISIGYILQVSIKYT